MLWELRDHLSYNALRKFKQCPESFRRYYFFEERGPLSSPLLIGRAAHAAIAKDLQARIGEGPGISSTELELAVHEAWEADIEEAGGVDEIDWGKDGERLTSSKDRLLLSERERSLAVVLASLHQSTCCTQYTDVEAVEEEFSLTVPGVAVPIIGYIDLRRTSGLKDFKTTWQKKNPLPGQYQLQGRIYQLIHPLPMGWDLLERRGKKITPDAWTLPYDEGTARATERIIQNTAKQIEWCWEQFGMHEPWPDAIDNEWACKYCPHSPAYNNTCFYYGSEEQ